MAPRDLDDDALTTGAVTDPAGTSLADDAFHGHRRGGVTAAASTR
jgi:hypothetical protein